ncbi:hypothetical protein GGR57DRAFT_482011 [Xylariaceae sp. FL1272]|nr:hypothetical protein GGR57DRAFT_482011 [Xylariaceae sp. FL1272]
MGGNAEFENGIPTPLDVNWGGVLTGRGVACFFSPVDQRTLVWALSVREQTPRQKYNNGDVEQVHKMLEEARDLGKTITEPFGTIVDTTAPESTFVFNTRDKQPFPHDMQMGPVIFMGDSNHAVSPFAGNGANLALQDGWDLAEQVCRSNSLEQAAAAYDRLSMPRAVETIKTSHSRIVIGHAIGYRYWMYRCLLSFAGFVLKILGKS